MQSSLNNSKNLFSSPLFLFLSFFLFLSSMNFLNKYFYFIFIAFTVFFFFINKSIAITPTFFLLLFLSFMLILFDTVSVNSILDIIRQFIFPLSYLLGINCINPQTYKAKKNQSNYEKLFLSFCFIISLGILIHVALNFYTNFDSEDRSIVDFWVNSSSSATGQAALFCFGIGCLPALFLNKSNKGLKIFAFISIFIFSSFALVLAVRTFFVLFAITFLCVFIYFICVIEDKIRALKTFFIILLILALLVALYQNDIFNLKNNFENSNFFERFFGNHSTMDIDEDSRLSNKSRYFAIMGEFPWGGGHIRDELNGAYAHELYLDTYNRAGIIPYILLIIFVFGSTFRAFRLVANKKFSILTNCLILGLFLSINIEFMIEPIMEGMPWLLPTFCILCGMVDYMVNYEPMDSIKY